MIVALKNLYDMSLKMRVILITLIQLVSNSRNKDNLQLFCFYWELMVQKVWGPSITSELCFSGHVIKMPTFFTTPQLESKVNQQDFLSVWEKGGSLKNEIRLFPID